MKIRQLRQAGFEPVVDAKGQMVYALIILKVGEETARDVGPAQVAAALRKGAARAQRAADSINPPAEAAAPEKVPA